MVVDVVGVATTVTPLGSVKRKFDQTELQRRDVTLVDSRHRSLLIQTPPKLLLARRSACKQERGACQRSLPAFVLLQPHDSVRSGYHAGAACSHGLLQLARAAAGGVAGERGGCLAVQLEDGEGDGLGGGGRGAGTPGGHLHLPLLRHCVPRVRF